MVAAHTSDGKITIFRFLSLLYARNLAYEAHIFSQRVFSLWFMLFQFDSDLEILGSIHIRADQEEVVNFLLDEKAGVNAG